MARRTETARKRPNRIAEIRDERGMTQEKLAEAANTGRSMIVKLERGERKLSVDWIVRLAKALRVSPKELLPPEEENPVPIATTPSIRQLPVDLPPNLEAHPVDFGPPDLPVYGRAAGGSGDLIMPVEQPPVEWTYRPTQLKGVSDAFAIFVSGDSMRPMYKPGQTLWIHPHLPLVSGEGVLVVFRDDRAIIKEFVRRSDAEIAVLEYRPTEREFTIPWSEIRQAYRIVGAHSLK